MLRVTSGKFKGKRLLLPPESIARPSSDKLRQAVFNILSNMVSFENLTVLDGFAGSGALGIEAVSRGAVEVVFCENDQLVQKVLKNNIISTIQNEASVTITNNIFQLKYQNQFDIVFLDPPYNKGLETTAIEYLLAQKLIAENGVVVVEQHKGASAIEFTQLESQPLRIYGKCQVTILQLSS